LKAIKDQCNSLGQVHDAIRDDFRLDEKLNDGNDDHVGMIELEFAQERFLESDATFVPTADSTIDPDAAQILVPSHLEYGFFDGTTLRRATREEVDGVLLQTNAFFEGVLREAYPELVAFQAVYVSDAFRADDSEYPVLVEFDAISYFPEGRLSS
jgi:hypothetical protein